ncbi:CBS domain-containing protein [Dactylosporangium sp. NPDC049140]|uniref:CBS domain-containing protein n=1 Tax=Dactylosporangium sp. NPDC049140 TaxID=3155647 RepID=UPI0033E79472
MSELRVRDVMSPSVVAVTADCTSRHVTDVITEFGVSGVPVVGQDDRVIGVISEADLLSRLTARDGADTPPADGLTAGELMSTPPVTVRAGAALSTAAGLMQRYRVKRLPVLDDDRGTLVGIVTRRDLLRNALRSDEAIERELMDELLLHGLWHKPGDITATVHDGEVQLSGGPGGRDAARLAAEIAANLTGVTAVRSNIATDRSRSA